jgi:hypothetical protein
MIINIMDIIRKINERDGKKQGGRGSSSTERIPYYYVTRAGGSSKNKKY